MHTEFSCVSVHALAAVPSRNMSRLRYRMPVLQEMEHALHGCKTTHKQSRLSARTQTLIAHTCQKAVRQSWPCTCSDCKLTDGVGEALVADACGGLFSDTDNVGSVIVAISVLLVDNDG